MEWVKANTPEELESFYRRILPDLRRVARDLGFGLGLHGSMRRDLDLIAIPWQEEHATKDELAEALQLSACGINQKAYYWETKPCGRVACSFPICWTELRLPSSGHIDLSVLILDHQIP